MFPGNDILLSTSHSFRNKSTVYFKIMHTKPLQMHNINTIGNSVLWCGSTTYEFDIFQLKVLHDWIGIALKGRSHERTELI